MKRFILSISLVLLIGLNLSGQKISPTFNPAAMDTLFVYEPVGGIFVPEKRQLVMNELITGLYIHSFDSVFSAASSIPVRYIPSDEFASDSMKVYLFDFMRRIERLEDNLFGIIKVDNQLQDILARQTGKYVALISFTGLDRHDMGKEFTKGLALGIGTAILSGGMFSVYTVPVEPFQDMSFLLLDREESKMLYYSHKNTQGAPVNPDKISKAIKKLTRDYPKTKKEKEE